MAKTTANISIDTDVKARAQELFSDLGMDLSTAINIFLRQTIRKNAIPFEITAEIPNKTTVAAINEYNEMLRNPQKFKEAMNEVLEDA